MRCAALFGGRPERGTAGLANDVRSSHVLIDLRVLRGRAGVGPVCDFFSGQSRHRPEETTPSPALRLAPIVSLQFWQE